MVLLFGSTLVVLGLLVTFAIALSNTQADSKAAIEARLHDRAVLAATLVDSLFATVKQQAPADAVKLGGRTVANAALDSYRGTNDYVVLLSRRGEVLAHSTGFTSGDRPRLSQSAVVRLVAAGHAYALGNLVPYRKSGVIELALALATRNGRRTLVQGIPPKTLGQFLGGELRRIPGVAGTQNLIVDSNDTVIASNLASRPTGYRISGSARSALGRSSGDRNGRDYIQVPLANSTWRLVLGAPDRTLFASISGVHRWVPWLIFVAFALVAGIALALGWRLLRSAELDLAESNAQLEAVNRALAASNQRLQQRAAELARSNADLEQFASIASHDLQEPLRKVRTFTDQLAATEADRLSERGADYLARANRAAERMQGLIQDLLQFSRVTTKPRELGEVDLNAVLNDVLDDLAVDIEESGAKVDAGKLPTLSADPLRMRQLVLNLISNALKFRREGVRPEVTVRGAVVGDTVRVTVSDNGIGFEQQYATRIFRVFERLNGRGEYAGTGIGLALCQKIVTRHGGEIVASGEPGVGATFTVTLPLDHQAGESEPLSASEPDLDHAKEQAHAIT